MLTLEGNVVPVLIMKPKDSIAFGVVKYGAGAVKTFTIEGEKGRPLEIEDIRVTPDSVTATLDKDPTTGVYTLKATLSKNAPVGNLKSGLLRIHTNYKDVPIVAIRVTGVVDSPLQYPRAVTFLLSKDKPESKTQKAVIAAPAGETLKVLKAETNIPRDVAATLETLEANKRYQVTLQYLGDMDAREFRGKLVVTTDSPIQPVIAISVWGRQEGATPTQGRTSAKASPRLKAPAPDKGKNR